MLLARLLDRVRSEPSRTPSVIVTLFGDAILPRGGEVALGTLLDVFRAMEVGDGVVRTAMSRLAADGWVERRRAGRNSFYRLSARAMAESTAAASVIYGALPTRDEARMRMAVDGDRAMLSAAGFVALAPGVMLAPSFAPARGCREGLEGCLMLDVTGPETTTRALAARLWPLSDAAARYHRLLALTADLPPPSLAGADALAARTLLIDGWRRAILRDPRLPSALLPPDWPAPAARAVCARLYAALLTPSEVWLDAHALPPPDAALHQRFAG